MRPGTVPEKAALASPPTLTVLGRGYCHLCDDMVAGLEPFRASHQVRIEVIDVDENPELEALHGERVPVLFLGEREICHYFLDVPQLTLVLNALSGKDQPAIR